MPSLVLRTRAKRHHRSMTREAVAILEKELAASAPVRLPPPVTPLRPVTTDEIDRTVHEGRE